MQFSITDHLDNALETARNAAVEHSNPAIGTEHILYGILCTRECEASKLLTEAGVNTDFAQRVFAIGRPARTVKPDYTKRVKAMFSTAQNMSQGIIDTEYFLYAMLIDSDSLASEILIRSYNVNINAFLRKLVQLIEQRTDDDRPNRTPAGEVPEELKEMGIDITKRAREGKIDPIIGRREEIESIIQTLSRKTKNNPVLIGEPGVGKSAVVEGLARAIVEGNVPEQLKNKIVFSLDVAGLVAGTKYRGALEEKLKKAIDAIKLSGNIIVFIDELHTLAQAGSRDGEVSPADILKPYLARGELQTVGATTTDEYRKYIEVDKALERRFQPITVNPPTVDETIEILRGLRESFETYHKVKLSDGAIEAAAKLSDRYIADRFLPDKAIDLIDEAMSKAKVSGNTAPDKDRAMLSELNKLEDQIYIEHKSGHYAQAASLNARYEELKKKLDESRLNWYRRSERDDMTIQSEHIAEIVSKWTGIPVTRMSESETERLMHLEEILHKRVIGQEKAVNAVAKAIRRARAGLNDPNRPIGSFLFLGPTGVGKTELTKALSEAMFDDPNAVVRIDMSEYMEAHSVSKLIGAPPGYAGFDDGGQLTEAVRRKPYSVVLFDEIEKAHPDVYNLLLQMLDDGRLTDSQGRVVNFKNTVIIMTSNVGIADLKASHSLGFAPSSVELDDRRTEEILTAALKRHFKPEFLNRIGVTCIFHSLKKGDIARIATLMLNKFAKTLAERSFTLSVSQEALALIVDMGYDIEYGARPLRRVIEQHIEDNVAEGIISGRIAPASTVYVHVVGGEIKIN